MFQNSSGPDRRRPGARLLMAGGAKSGFVAERFFSTELRTSEGASDGPSRLIGFMTVGYRATPLDSRTISSPSSRMSRAGMYGRSIRSSIAVSAASPIARQGWRTVVSGTGNSDA